MVQSGRSIQLRRWAADRRQAPLVGASPAAQSRHAEATTANKTGNRLDDEQAVAGRATMEDATAESARRVELVHRERREHGSRRRQSVCDVGPLGPRRQSNAR
jgi:hypothetical protein